jgi:biogenesis of lysosome-related organelles complex 1 subunit 2
MESLVVDDQQRKNVVEEGEKTEDGEKLAQGSGEQQKVETVSLSESAGKENAPEQPRIQQFCEDMFKKTADYLRGELTSTADEYRLLENLNKLTIAKYADMSTLGTNLTSAMSDLNDKYKNLEPYLAQVEQLETSVAALEQAAYRLDAYSKRLEAKFKQLEKKS